MEDEGRKPWERQDWETATAFRRFTDYYLSQSPPRSIDQGYRNWYCDKRGWDRGDERVARKRHSGTWQRWAQARDRYGDKVPDGLTWTERAAAWDDYVAAKARRELEAKEKRVLSEGYALYFERIHDLNALAELLYRELQEEDNRWVPDVKQIGSGDDAYRVDLVRFNSALIEQFRRTLDDIAAELGERVKGLEIHGEMQQAGAGPGFGDVTDERLDDLIHQLAAAEGALGRGDDGEDPAA